MWQIPYLIWKKHANNTGCGDVLNGVKVDHVMQLNCIKLWQKGLMGVAVQSLLNIIHSFCKWTTDLISSWPSLWVPWKTLACHYTLKAWTFLNMPLCKQRPFSSSSKCMRVHSNLVLHPTWPFLTNYPLSAKHNRLFPAYQIS